MFSWKNSKHIFTVIFLIITIAILSYLNLNNKLTVTNYSYKHYFNVLLAKYEPQLDTVNPYVTITFDKHISVQEYLDLDVYVGDNLLSKDSYFLEKYNVSTLYIKFRDDDVWSENILKISISKDKNNFLQSDFSASIDISSQEFAYIRESETDNDIDQIVWGRVDDIDSSKHESIIESKDIQSFVSDTQYIVYSTLESITSQNVINENLHINDIASGNETIIKRENADTYNRFLSINFNPYNSNQFIAIVEKTQWREGLPYVASRRLNLFDRDESGKWIATEIIFPNEQDYFEYAYFDRYGQNVYLGYEDKTLAIMNFLMYLKTGDADIFKLDKTWGAIDMANEYSLAYDTYLPGNGNRGVILKENNSSSTIISDPEKNCADAIAFGKNKIVYSCITNESSTIYGFFAPYVYDKTSSSREQLFTGADYTKMSYSLLLPDISNNSRYISFEKNIESDYTENIYVKSGLSRPKKSTIVIFDMENLDAGISPITQFDGRGLQWR